MKNMFSMLPGVFGMVVSLVAFVSHAQNSVTPPPLPQPITPPGQRAAPPPMIAHPLPPGPPSLEAFIKWDADTKEQTVSAGTQQAAFTFNLTNVSAEVVTINSAVTSCGCTVAKLPETPWHIQPGGSGQISATMNLLGKMGTIVKTITVTGDKGTKLLYVRSIILPQTVASQQMSEADRERNQKLAVADRQAVFKGDCARCHAAPAKGKMGQQLFTDVCGVCHEAKNRATMVADLHKIPQETNAEFWRNWIAHGKPGTLMPAFSQAEDGILTDDQINSLVNYLVATIPSRSAAMVAKPAGKLN